MASHNGIVRNYGHFGQNGVAGIAYGIYTLRSELLGGVCRGITADCYGA